MWKKTAPDWYSLIYSLTYPNIAAIAHNRRIKKEKKNASYLYSIYDNQFLTYIYILIRTDLNDTFASGDLTDEEMTPIPFNPLS